MEEGANSTRAVASGPGRKFARNSPLLTLGYEERTQSSSLSQQFPSLGQHIDVLFKPCISFVQRRFTMGISSCLLVQNLFFGGSKVRKGCRKGKQIISQVSQLHNPDYANYLGELCTSINADFYLKAEQGKIAPEEEEIGEDSQFMMLAKKVTAKALQKNGELLVRLRVQSPGADSNLQWLLQPSHGPVSYIVLKKRGETVFLDLCLLGCAYCTYECRQLVLLYVLRQLIGMNSGFFYLVAQH